MANFVLVVDRDENRRSRFIQEISASLCTADYLRVNSCQVGSFDAVWASFDGAPISVNVDADGAAIVWGEAIKADSVARLEAAELRRDRRNALHSSWTAYDGYYAAAVYSEAEGMTIEADLLGLYPVYYCCTAEVLLVGSSPELLLRHPAVGHDLDPHGLVGILLTNSLVDGRTLWQSVRRLGAGCQLQWTPGEGSRETARYQLPMSDRLFGIPLSEQVVLLGDALEQAVARHAPRGRSCALLLSGGLDSRLLGGYLEACGVEVKALTIGRSTDTGMQCARRVARALHFEHHDIPIPLPEYPQLAELGSRWEQLAGGFELFFQWGITSALRALSDFTVMGNALDGAIGNGYLSFIYSPETCSPSWQKHLDFVNSQGIDRATLRGLVRPGICATAIDDVVERIQEIGRGYAGLDFQRFWAFVLLHRQRYRACTMAWVHSMGSWPILPVLDRKILEIAAALPANVIAERQGEHGVLSRRFPRLAQLPLDRGERVALPLRPRLRQEIAWSIRRQSMPMVDRWKRITHTDTIEHRFVEQVMDFSSSPGWADVRRRAERDRHKILHLFDEGALNEFLPPPDTPIVLENPVSGPSGRKLLLGLMIFAGQHW